MTTAIMALTWPRYGRSLLQRAFKKGTTLSVGANIDQTTKKLRIVVAIIWRRDLVPTKINKVPRLLLSDIEVSQK